MDGSLNMHRYYNKTNAVSGVNEYTSRQNIIIQDQEYE